MGQPRPLLKQFGELTVADFESCGVWVLIHTMDYSEPWYDDPSNDEETVRPWTGPLPVDPNKGMFLISAQLEFADGSKHPGFLNPHPLDEPFHLKNVQPQVFSPHGARYGFWTGIGRIDREDLVEFYRDFGKTSAEVFPVKFQSSSKLALGLTHGALDGFTSGKMQRISK